MALLDEARVRLMSDNGTRGPVAVGRDDVLTPSARTWLREHKVEVVYPQGGGGEGGDKPGPRYQTLFGAALEEKPEHMTHLRGNILVFKDHPRIVFRGYIDRLEAEISLCQRTCAREGYKKLAAELGEVLEFVRKFIRYDVLDEPVGEFRLCGMGPEELREKSHYPEKYFGQPHFMVSAADSPALLEVNRVRTTVRQTELAAYRAFRNRDGGVERGDIILGLNRLSSLFWIFMIKLKAGKYERSD